MPNKDVKYQEKIGAIQLIDHFIENFEIFQSKKGVVYATDNQTGNTFELNSTFFKDQIRANFYREFNLTIRDQIIKEALSTLTGIGRKATHVVDVFKRVGKHQNVIFLDLCMLEEKAAIQITPGEWQIITPPPIKFLRHDGMQPLPEPVPNGDINLLWKICNIPKSGRLLVLTWLLECLRMDTPFPLLELVGEQGTAKSTTHSALKMLIDPHACNLRASPRNIDDLFVAAGKNHILGYENVSYFNPRLQDSLCVTATGGSHAKRKHYSDGEEFIIESKNPIIINGITSCVTAQDLIDRTITIELERLDSRSSISELNQSYEIDRPQILGGLLDLFCETLKALPAVKIPEHDKPRLMEYYALGVAMTVVLGYDSSAFTYSFNETRHNALIRSIEANPVAEAMLAYRDKKGPLTIELPTKQLKQELEQYVNHGDIWPKSAKGFSDALQRAAPVLRQVGINCQNLGKRGSYVYWKVSPVEAKFSLTT